MRPDGAQQPSAWRFPSPLTALASALALHRALVVQSRGEQVRRVDWVQSAAMLVRREAAAEVGYFDPAFFVYSDEVDFCRRLADAGWHTLYVPGARAVHHEQLSTGNVPTRRIVEFSRNRDRYMRKHHSALSAALVRYLTAFTYGCRAAAALVLPGHDPKRYAAHVSATLHPGRGEGLRRGRAGVQPAVEGLSSRRAASSSPGRKKRAATSAGAIAAERDRPRDEAGDALRRQQQLARGRDPARDEHEARQPAPLERDREQVAGQRPHHDQHHDVGTDQRQPGAGDPERRRRAAPAARR